MAQQQLKKLKYDGKEVVVEVANRDGNGNVITSTYQKNIIASTGLEKAVDGVTLSVRPATTSTLGGVKIGNGIAVDENGVISTSSLTWSNVTGKPFSTLNNSDFSVSDSVLSINTTNWGDKEWVEDNFLSTDTPIPATNVIPATSSASKVLLSTSTSGTAAWSSANLGSNSTTPLYLTSTGNLAAGYAYAGGTKITLNGTNKSGREVEIFAPTTGGGKGTLLVSNGPANEPAFSDSTTWSGAAGFLKVNSTGITSIDTHTYLTEHQSLSEYYTKTEINGLISGIKQFAYEPAATLPTASSSTMYKIYLIPSTNSEESNVKEEYITIDNGSEADPRYTWEHIGSTNLNVDNFVAAETFASTTLVKDYIRQFIDKNSVPSGTKWERSFVWNPSDIEGKIYNVGIYFNTSGTYDIEVESLIGSDRWTYSAYMAGGQGDTLTFASIIADGNKHNYVLGQSITGNSLAPAASYIITTTAVANQITQSTYSIDSSESSIANNAAKIPNSKAVYAQLATKQATLTAGSGISIGTVNNVANTISWDNPFTVTDVTLDY